MAPSTERSIANEPRLVAAVHYCVLHQRRPDGATKTMNAVSAFTKRRFKKAEAPRRNLLYESQVAAVMEEMCQEYGVEVAPLQGYVANTVLYNAAGVVQGIVMPYDPTALAVPGVPVHAAILPAPAPVTPAAPVEASSAEVATSPLQVKLAKEVHKSPVRATLARLSEKLFGAADFFNEEQHIHHLLDHTTGMVIALYIPFTEEQNNIVYKWFEDNDEVLFPSNKLFHRGEIEDSNLAKSGIGAQAQTGVHASKITHKSKLHGTSYISEDVSTTSGCKTYVAFKEDPLQYESIHITLTELVAKLTRKELETIPNEVERAFILQERPASKGKAMQEALDQKEYKHMVDSLNKRFSATGFYHKSHPTVTFGSEYTDSITFTRTCPFTSSSAGGGLPPARPYIRPHKDFNWGWNTNITAVSDLSKLDSTREGLFFDMKKSRQFMKPGVVLADWSNLHGSTTCEHVRRYSASSYKSIDTQVSAILTEQGAAQVEGADNFRVIEANYRRAYENVVAPMLKLPTPYQSRKRKAPPPPPPPLAPRLTRSGVASSSSSSL